MGRVVLLGGFVAVLIGAGAVLRGSWPGDGGETGDESTSTSTSVPPEGASLASSTAAPEDEPETTTTEPTTTTAGPEVEETTVTSTSDSSITPSERALTIEMATAYSESSPASVPSNKIVFGEPVFCFDFYWTAHYESSFTLNVDVKGGNQGVDPVARPGEVEFAQGSTQLAGERIHEWNLLGLTYR